MIFFVPTEKLSETILQGTKSIISTSQGFFFFFFFFGGGGGGGGDKIQNLDLDLTIFTSKGFLPL